MEECFCIPSYGMEKSKSSKCWDPLSELPDSLIVLILSFLETKDVLRTTILSKHWKHLWNTVPCLNFKDSANDCLRFQNIVNRTLVIWKGTKILKFGVDFWYEESAASDLDLWLRFATENQVEELNVNLIGDWNKYLSDCVDTNYLAPQSLYACSSIRKLGLKGCNLKIHGNVHWDSLKCLTIDCVFLSKHVIDKVLFGAPQLEVLILRIRENYESLNIRSNSLKRLTVEKYLEFGDDQTVDTVLKIWASKVETLELLGVLYKKCVLLNVSSLTKATVVLEPPIEDDNNGRYSGFKLLEDILEQIYCSKRRVEQVTLPYLCIDKVFGKMMNKVMLAPLSYAKFLKLCGVTKDDEILHVLEIFPKLTVLVLEGTDSSRKSIVTLENHLTRRTLKQVFLTHVYCT